MNEARPSEEPHHMRMRVLEPSRKRRKPGEIFVMLPPDGRYLYGRVVRTDLKETWSVQNLVYIFKARSDTVLPIPPLSPNDLLIGPMLVTDDPWFEGYFKTIEQRPLRQEDVLSRHALYDELRDCFWDIDSKTRVSRGPGPIGTTAIWLLPGIDQQILHALGIESFPWLEPRHRPL